MKREWDIQREREEYIKRYIERWKAKEVRSRVQESEEGEKRGVLNRGPVGG